MKNIFAGLESLGLKGTDKVDVFEEKTEEKAHEQAEHQEKKKEVTEEDLLFEKSYTCPVCDNEFKSKMVRTGKVRLAGADSDLRPKYMGVDALKYDAVLCPKCGYAALNRYFNFIMARQAANIKEQISKTFTYEDKEDKVYDYDDAIMRHKLALLNTVVKNGKNSERAYTCLKLAWLYRGKREMLLQQEEHDKDEVIQLATEEKELLTNAYEGFESAFSREDFPMFFTANMSLGVNLLAELARRIGDNEAAARHVSKVLVGKNVQKRIKDKAVDLKEKLHTHE